MNRAIGVLVRVGIGLPHMRVLEVRGRTSGKVREITLRRGFRAERCRLRPLADAEKPPILKAYLDQFRREVQRYFPVPAESPASRFASLAPRYPVYELLPAPLPSGDRT
ncbi:MAG TPA: hypothetical protein VMS64_32050 [Candidatus Methylomirabilis sp.]|nr:hypothetical protein [Candidatus Methylomirabilis sp.]